jgi:hypothetical protein
VTGSLVQGAITRSIAIPGGNLRLVDMLGVTASSSSDGRRGSVNAGSLHPSRAGPMYAEGDLASPRSISMLSTSIKGGLSFGEAMSAQGAAADPHIHRHTHIDTHTHTYTHTHIHTYTHTHTLSLSVPRLPCVRAAALACVVTREATQEAVQVASGHPFAQPAARDHGGSVRGHEGAWHGPYPVALSLSLALFADGCLVV